MHENGGGGGAECNSMENGEGFKKHGGDVRATIGPKNDRREGGV